MAAATDTVVAHSLHYGVHHAQLSGPLQLQDGSHLVVQLRLYYKAVSMGDHVVLRVQAHVFDSIRYGPLNALLVSFNNRMRQFSGHHPVVKLAATLATDCC